MQDVHNHSPESYTESIQDPKSKRETMKTVNPETTFLTDPLGILPKRRTILLLRREKLEQQQAQKEQARQKKLIAKSREQKRKKLLKSPPVKICARIGSAFWALFISLILTLLACYLAANPQTFSTLVRPVEQFFEIGIAGAAPPASNSTASNKTATLNAELVVEKEFSPKYLGKDFELARLLGTTRKHKVGEYTGIVALEKIEITPKVGIVKEKVDKVVEFDQLPTNDLNQLPLEQTFTLRSDKELDAEVEVSLKAAEWEWEVQSYDDFGLPKEYKARVTYRGEETWIDCKSLMVTAHYAGQLSKEIADTVEPEQTVRPQSPRQPAPPEQQPVPTPAPTPNLVPERVAEEAPSEDVEIVVNEAQDAEPRALEPAFIPAIEEFEEDDADDGKLWITLAVGAAGAAAASAGTAAAVIFYRRRRRQLDENEYENEEEFEYYYEAD